MSTLTDALIKGIKQTDSPAGIVLSYKNMYRLHRENPTVAYDEDRGLIALFGVEVTAVNWISNDEVWIFDRDAWNNVRTRPVLIEVPQGKP